MAPVKLYYRPGRRLLLSMTKARKRRAINPHISLTHTYTQACFYANTHSPTPTQRYTQTTATTHRHPTNDTYHKRAHSWTFLESLEADARCKAVRSGGQSEKCDRRRPRMTVPTPYPLLTPSPLRAPYHQPSCPCTVKQNIVCIKCGPLVATSSQRGKKHRWWLPMEQISGKT